METINKSEYRAKVPKLCADLVEQYTTITEMTSELIQALIDKIYIYESEIIDGVLMELIP